jgi:outer membrane protein OmpA-like peptidoglycan-associated protein
MEMNSTAQTSINLDVSEVIRSAATSALGIIALVCILLAVLSFGLFRGSSDRYKLIVFGFAFLGAALLTGTLLHEGRKQVEQKQSGQNETTVKSPKSDQPPQAAKQPQADPASNSASLPTPGQKVAVTSQPQAASSINNKEETGKTQSDTKESAIKTARKSTLPVVASHSFKKKGMAIDTDAGLFDEPSVTPPDGPPPDSYVPISVYFAWNSKNLTKKAKSDLDRLVISYGIQYHWKIKIASYYRREESDWDNSIYERGDAIKSYLVSQGIPASHVNALPAMETSRGSANTPVFSQVTSSK